MNYSVCLFALSFIAVQPDQRPLTPADAISAAHADSAKSPSAYTRYFSLYSIPTEERPDYIRALNGHCNGLSREVDTKPLYIVPGTQGALLRLNLLDYQWDSSVWEKLIDPYFTAVVETKVDTYWGGGIWKDDGRHYPAGSFKYYKRVKTQALAPWLVGNEEEKRKLTELVLYTGSKIPVVRGDWFLRETCIQEDRNVGYYDFLGIKNQKDFEKVVRFDAGLAKQLEHRRAMVFSGIALQPRRIERTATVMGGLWRTFDNQKAVDQHNPLRILDDDFKFEATEQIGPLPNGLPAFYLGDNKGNKQDKAPDKIIGGDRLGTDNDTRLHVCLSCIRCHFGFVEKEMGVKDANFAKIAKLKSTDYQKFQELSRQYLRDIAEPIQNDRVNYQKAIKRATGMEPFAYATQFAKIYSNYEGAVTPERAAADLGVTREAMIKSFREYDARTELDPLLSLLMDDKSIGVVQWEEIIPTAHLVIRGLQPVK